MTRRERIEERAHGRCEYCHAPQNIAAYTFHLEHLKPKKTGGRNTDANFALSCWNRNNKKACHVDGVDPDSGAVVPLFNPRTDDWDTHFELGFYAYRDPRQNLMWQSYGGSSPHERLLAGRSSNSLASDTGLAIAVILISLWEKRLSPRRVPSGLSFLFLLGAPRFA